MPALFCRNLVTDSIFRSQSCCSEGNVSFQKTVSFISCGSIALTNPALEVNLACGVCPSLVPKDGHESSTCSQMCRCERQRASSLVHKTEQAIFISCVVLGEVTLDVLCTRIMTNPLPETNNFVQREHFVRSEETPHLCTALDADCPHDTCSVHRDWS